MSTLRVNNITDASGGSSSLSVPGAAKAWVNFDGTGTVAIRAQLNVSSITDNGVGDYTVNFATAMADANYSIVGSHQWDQAGTSSGSGVFINIARYSGALSSGSVRVLGNVGNSSALYDGTTVTVAIHR